MSEENISQVKFEEVFIKALLDKLKVGNRRGIHLNAIPGVARSRLDLAELDEIKDGLSKDFLGKLLNDEEFEFTVNFEGVNFTDIEEKQKEKLDFIARKLNNISIDDEDQFLESGIRNFGFGYPLLVRRDKADPDKVIKAPLLIWSLDIEKSSRKQSYWTIKKSVDSGAHINQLLRSHVLRDSQISIDTLDEAYLEDNVIDQDELFEICENILSQINTQSSAFDIKDFKVEKCPAGRTIDGLATDEAWIQWSGVFGIYTSRKESVIRQAEKILKELPKFKEEKLILDKFQTSTVSAVSTDPSKEQIINTLTDSEVKLIQGPPGTGKSQALTAIITNVLENGGKCLVVCEKRTALNVIQRNLAKIGLDNMTVLIDDVSKDRSAVVKKVRSVVDNAQDHGGGLLHGEKENYEKKYKEFCALKESFNGKHHSERESQIDGVAWKDSIGVFLQASEEVEWVEIKSAFPKEFKLSEEEYLQLESTAKDAAVAYSKLDNEDTASFGLVKNKIFESKFSRRSSDELLEALTEIKHQTEILKEHVGDKSQDDLVVSDISIFNISELKEYKSTATEELDMCKEAVIITSGFIDDVKLHPFTSYKSAIFEGVEEKEALGLLVPSELVVDVEKRLESIGSNIKYLQILIKHCEVISSFLTTSDEETSNINLNLTEFSDGVEEIEGLLETESSKKEELKSLLETLNLLVEDNGVDSLELDFGDKTIGLLKGGQSSTKRKKLVRSLIQINAELFDEDCTFSFFDLSLIEEVHKENTAQKTVLESTLKGVKALIQLSGKVLKQEEALNNTTREFLSGVELDFSTQESISDYQSSLDSLLEKTNNMVDAFGLYEAVHQWGYFYQSLDGNFKKIISALIKSGLDTKLWLSGVRAWRYYYSLLELEEKSSGFHTDEEELLRLLDIYTELKAEQIKILQFQWERDIQANVSSNYRILYNLRKNNTHSRTNSLRKIIHDDFNQFSSIFPVILTNPLAADAMLPLEIGLFDVVIFDEASQLRIEDTFTSFIRGKYKVIAGDKHQMPPSNYFQREGDVKDGEEYTEEELLESELARSESLLDYAETLSYSKQSYLDYHYRSQHPALIDFSNAAFYGGNLVPFPEKFAYTPIKFHELDGIFEKQEGRAGKINKKEIDEVIRILREDLQPKSDGSYPSVGIATFNISQRDAITDRMNDEMAFDSSFASKIEAIKESENGLFIKNLENIQGDEMDIVIISTTYGKDVEGKFFERFGPLNLDRAYKLLNVLITRARETVYVCTSIPSNKYANYSELLDQYKNNKKAILYAYLAYAKAVANAQLEDADAVKTELLKHTHDQPRSRNLKEGLVESPFEQEVYECLLEKIDGKSITPQKRIGGFRVDFLIEIGDEKVVIECDGKTYHSSNEAYAYDMFRQRELEDLGFKVYRIWSTKWWHNHTLEIDKLMNYLDSLAGH